MSALPFARWLLIALSILGVLNTALRTWAQPEQAPVVVAEITGVINPLSAEYLERAIATAQDEHARALVITMDTPGGLDTAMRTMVQAILASHMPIIVYVSPAGARAASAGLFVSMAAHVVAMAPGTNLGAAHPVSLGGGQQGDTEMAKVEADAAAYIRALAETRGRNADWAERAVRESIAAPASEALALNVVDLLANDLPDLLAQLDGRRARTADGEQILHTAGAAVISLPMNPVERFLHSISDPNIAFVLLSLGTVGLIAEFYHPGTVIPGASGAIALLLAWAALGNLPTNWVGAVLLILGVVLVVAEAHTPLMGASAIAGGIAFTLGALLLFRPIGSVSATAPAVALSPVVVIAAGAAAVAFSLVVVRAIVRTRRMKAMSGQAVLIGAIGTARGDLNPHGIVHVAGEDWSATAEAPILGGGPAQVVRVEGVTLVVRPAPGAEVVPSTGTTA